MGVYDLFYIFFYIVYNFVCWYVGIVKLQLVSSCPYFGEYGYS